MRILLTLFAATAAASAAFTASGARPQLPLRASAESPSPRKALPMARTAAPQETPDVNLQACVVYSGKGLSEGLYRIPLTGSGEFTQISNDLYGNYGYTVADNRIYTLTYTYNEYTDVETNVVKIYDSGTGELISSYEGTTPMQAWDTAVDPTTGTIYGIFFNDNTDGYVFGTIDYEERVRTAIADLPSVMMGLAINAQGEAFVIDPAGGLYSIDKQSGKMTLIGQTGAASYFNTSATIDPTTGIMYYAINDIGIGALYMIDVTNAETTLLAKFPGDEELCGLHVATPPAPPTAPASAENLKASFAGKSLSGEISFDIPASLFDGTAASGDVTYSVSANDIALPSGTAPHGSSVKCPLTLPAPDDYRFTVTLTNGNGDSPVARISAYVGADTPATPRVTVLRDGDSFRISWQPVTTGQHGGYVETSDITYDVVRQPGEIKIASATRATSVADQGPFPETLTAMHYEVTACDGDLRSQPGRSATHAVGCAALPFRESFDTSAALDIFTVIDANGDGKRWEVADGALRIGYNEELPMDDWVVTPPLRLEKGKRYSIGFVSYCQGIPEKIEVKWGNAPTAEAMTATLLGPTVVSAKVESPARHSLDLVATEDGVFHVGIHGISDADCHILYLDDLTISAGISADAPGAVSDLTITPAPGGVLSAEVSLTAPALTTSGSALTAIDHIIVTRDGTEVKRFTNPEPGKPRSFTDTDIPAKGNHTWTAYAVADGNEGIPTSVTAYVGVNRPAAVEKLTVAETDTEGEVTLSWTPVTKDINGIDFGDVPVTYDLYLVDGADLSIVRKGITGTNTHTYRALEAGKPQDFMQWAVCPSTETGDGETTHSAMIPVGPAFQCPFAESFPDRKPTTPLMINPEGYATWNFYNDTDMTDAHSSDNDNGYACMQGSYVGDYAELITGKIRLGNDNPALGFDNYCIGDDDINELDVYVISQGAKSRIHHMVVNASGTPAQWNEVIIPLDAYAGKAIQLSFLGTIKDYSSLLIDHIRVADNLASVTAPAADGSVISVKATRGAITVTGAQGRPITVYAPDGRPAAAIAIAADSEQLPLPAGAYLVKAGETTAKVIVR